MFQPHLGSILNLSRRSAKQLTGSTGSHRTGNPYFSLAAYLRSGNRRIGSYHISEQSGRCQCTQDTGIAELTGIFQMIQHRRTLANESFNELKTAQVYEMSTIKDIQAWCEKTGHSYWEYVEQCEGPEIWDYLAEVWDVMQKAVQSGLEAEGILPGGLGIRRKASDYLIRAKGYGSSIKSRGMVYAFALAVSEDFRWQAYRRQYCTQSTIPVLRRSH